MDELTPVGARDAGATRRAPRGGDLTAAARESGVVWAGMVALGVGFGALVTAHGLPWWLAPVISATVFAGSVEFVLVGMLATAAPVAAVAVTTLLVNSRHLFYGLTFPLHRVRGRLGRAYSVFALCDEAYALTAGKAPEALSGGRIVWTQFGMHAGWAAGSAAGGVLGATVLGGLHGLDFVLTALFVVLTLDAYRARPDRRTLVLAAGCAGLALVATSALGSQAMLPVAMTSFTACLLARHHVTRRPGRA
ncbi:AzlC family ABC transporter permease [Kineococcus glutinatus]|uniref:AzlC family ABC transporter permease n=1 Tax=Kineococcus glutinatus TaxID=1070872 RepID=A0ABP9H9C6_9ACTN